MNPDDDPPALELTTLGLEVDDGVATVTLDRPEVLNAFDPTMVEELRSVWQALRADPEVRAVVLTASGRQGVLHRHRPLERARVPLRPVPVRGSRAA